MNEKLIIISAPSGAGKTTIVKQLLNSDLNLEFSVSACSRPKRENETNGKDYYFLSVDEFKTKIKNDEFLEWEEVYKDQFYGTLKSEITRIWNKGNFVIFDVDVVGGLNIKKYYKEKALAIFIKPPSQKVLKERLELRKELASKKDFTIQKPLLFTRKVTVKSLPIAGSLDQSVDQKNSIKEQTTTSTEPTSKLVGFQKLDKVKPIKPIKIHKLKVKPIAPKVNEDDKTSIKPIGSKSLKPKMPMELFSSEVEITKEMDRPKVINFPRELQKIIIKRGSSLSLLMCENLITELKNSLERPISLSDVKMAAEFFVKQEQFT